MNVTIKEVAKLAGGTISTVSRTCTNHPKISEKTKEKVREAMKILKLELRKFPWKSSAPSPS